FTEEPRSATVRAEERATVLRLSRERLLALVRQVPALSLAIVETLSRRLQTANLARAEGEAFLARHLAEAPAGLSPRAREAGLTASLLEEPTAEALAVLFGPDAPIVKADLRALGVDDRPSGPATRRALRRQLDHEWGGEGLTSRAASVAAHLAGAGRWDDALAVLARPGPRSAFVDMLAPARRAGPPPRPD